ncbi:MAG TPA: adenosylcobalamin-dependent ribonucleoside-diphosphate reductase, partial [Gaiellaceae bacterium]|nr:adenosylcobalamin-dependent ribonucleoside-diphosphate reductase [Gaiellaceae bacterium]
MASVEQKNASDQAAEEVANSVVDEGARLGVRRYFTIPGRDPFDEIDWEIRDATIPGRTGPAFEQRGVEFPKFWSQTATNIVAQKYFRGRLSSPERESSVKQMVGRVVDTAVAWGKEGGYFADDEEARTFEAELKAILVNQYASFNSPVWFNVGFEEKPQCSACQPYHALVSTPDGMVAIGELVEGEQVDREVYDSQGTTRIVAVKHNGRKPVYRVTLRNGQSVEATADHVVKAVRERRTEPVWLRVDQLEPGMRMHLHPHRAKVARPVGVTVGAPTVEALDGIEGGDEVRVAEAALAGWLQADGFVGQYAAGTNRSLTLEFQVANDEELDWVCGNLDAALPSVHRNLRDVHAADGSVSCRRVRLYGERLREFVDEWELLQRGSEIRVPRRLWTASHEEIAAYLRSVFQADGFVTVQRVEGSERGRIGFAVISEKWSEDIQLLLNVLGIYSRRVRKHEPRSDRHDLYEVQISIGSERARFAELIGFVSRAKQSRLLESLALRGLKHCPDLREEEIVSIEPQGVQEVFDIQTESGEYLTNNVVVHNCFILSIEDSMESILDWIRREGVIFRGGSGSGVNLSKLRSSKEQLSKGGHASGPVSFMRGADASAGTIKSGGKTRRAAKMVVLDVDHPDVEEFIWCKAKEERKARVLEQAGYDMSLNSADWASIQYQNANNSVRVSDAFMGAATEGREFNLTARTDGSVLATVDARDLLRQIAAAAWECADPGVQYDTTINSWHTLPNTGRINASNPCSEYMSIDDSACNLASLNLMKFRREDGELDVEAFEHAVDVVFLAQEILVGYSSYPTPEIERNAKAFRQLGLGYANLGALLMARGLPYDSDEGRAYAAAITALMTGRAYRKSAEIASRMGPFAGYQVNRAPMIGVIAKHRAAVGNIENSDVVPTDLLSACRQAWDDALNLGEIHGYRNAQATVLAPTGCLVGDSLVSTSRGLVRLRSLGDPVGSKWQPLDVEVATDEGPRTATRFYVNGFEQVVSIETGRGYRIQGTPTHRIKVVDEDGHWVWRRFAEVGAGDRVPLMRGSIVGEPQSVELPPLGELYWTADFRTRAPRELTPELAELVGYFMGDGSLHAKGLRFCVSREDADVVEHLVDVGAALFGLDATVTAKTGYTEVAFNSVPLALWWEACGFAKLPPSAEHSGKGWHGHIPDAILHTNDRAVYSAFVRGLFEADGTTNNGYVSWTTTTESFSRDVQSLLLTLGFVTTRKIDGAGSSWGANDRFVLRLLNVTASERYLEEIDFISLRKAASLWTGDHRQASRHDHVPVGRALVDELVPGNDALRKTMLMSLARRGDVSRRSATELLERTESPELEQLLGFYYDTVSTVETLDDQPTYDISVPDNVTYVANGFVSHNTISFMMDCDTTGVEPDFSLVKSKKLVGGGEITIVNKTVPMALEKLGYTPREIEETVAFIDERNSIVGVPYVKTEHYPVFDCAVGDRAIHYLGHVKMMGAVQPFISGAISKTVNMPEEATVEDVMSLYVDAWKLGVKAIAIYRDNCKVAQPLSSQQTAATPPVPIRERKRLPLDRTEIGRKFQVGDHEGYIHVGLYDDGSPGDIFVDIAKDGTTMAGLMNSLCLAVSMGLQYGVPPEV